MNSIEYLEINWILEKLQNEGLGTSIYYNDRMDINQCLPSGQ